MVKERHWRNRHEPERSPPDYENLFRAINSLLRASARHGEAGSCCEFCSLIRRGGVPSGAGVIIVFEGKSDDNPRIRAEYNDFHRICSIPMLNTPWVSFLPLCAPPIRDNPTKKYYISIAVSERRVKRDRLMSPPSSNRCFLWYFLIQGLLQSQKTIFAETAG
jgi:hypothetical protein